MACGCGGGRLGLGAGGAEVQRASGEKGEGGDCRHYDLDALHGQPPVMRQDGRAQRQQRYRDAHTDYRRHNPRHAPAHRHRRLLRRRRRALLPHHLHRRRRAPRRRTRIPRCRCTRLRSPTTWSCIYKRRLGRRGRADARLGREAAGMGADFLICPDNTIHQALPYIVPRSPLPWLHIAEVVAARGQGTRLPTCGADGHSLAGGEVYPGSLRARN